MKLQCEHCGDIMTPKKKDKYIPRRFCTVKCRHLSRVTLVTKPCGQCGNPVTRTKRELLASKSGCLFCGHSCSARYSNTHKTKGTRRSKLEVWLESRLRELYPDLDIHCNRREAIQLELDFYFPSLDLAFEINGPLHYDPIYGQRNLEAIRRRDEEKQTRCSRHAIELCVVDVWQLPFFSENKAGSFLELMREKLGLKVSQSLERGLNPRSNDPLRGKVEVAVTTTKHYHRVASLLEQAMTWEKEILDGKTTRSQLARERGWDPTRVTRIMDLLYLPDDVKSGILHRDREYELMRPTHAMREGKRLKNEFPQKVLPPRYLCQKQAS